MIVGILAAEQDVQSLDFACISVRKIGQFEVAVCVAPQIVFARKERDFGGREVYFELTYLADGNVSEIEALNILLGGQYSNNHGEDEPTDREALNILLGGNER